MHDHTKVLTEVPVSNHATQCRVAIASHAHDCRTSPMATVVFKGAWLQLYLGLKYSTGQAARCKQHSLDAHDISVCLYANRRASEANRIILSLCYCSMHAMDMPTTANSHEDVDDHSGSEGLCSGGTFQPIQWNSTKSAIGLSGAGLSDWVCIGISTNLEQSEVIVLIWVICWSCSSSLRIPQLSHRLSDLPDYWNAIAALESAQTVVRQSVFTST